MELVRALAVLAEPPGPEAARLAEVLELGAAPSPEDYTELFLFQLYPYASVYVGPEGQLGGEARDRIAGFWRALGLTPPSEPDHVAALLGLYAEVAGREEDATEASQRMTWRRACHALLWEHLLSWMPPYLSHMERQALQPYARWATLLGDVLKEEAARLGGPGALPLHLREAPAAAGAGAGADEWLAALLAPVRSGVILTRADLARGARLLGLGLRAGERRFALRALLEQDARATLGWVADEARTWEGRHASGATGVGRIVAEWWARRAHESAVAIDTLLAKENVHA